MDNLSHAFQAIAKQGETLRLASQTAISLATAFSVPFPLASKLLAIKAEN